MLRVDSVVYQDKYAEVTRLVSTRVRDTMLAMSTRVPRRRRMASRRRRGVGMKGTGRSMVVRVVGMLRERASTLCEW